MLDFRSQLEIVRLTPSHEASFAEFLEQLCIQGDEPRFHPHPLTRDAARTRCQYVGNDVYCLAILGERVVGYGMLRGWDEGFDVPSLGIAVLAAARGIGLGRALMEYLHAEACRRGAPRIRLKVYPDNETALSLYRSLGYRFREALEQGQLVGFRELRSNRPDLGSQRTADSGDRQ